MIDWLRQLVKPEYEPLNQVEIIKQNILDNFSYLQSLAPQQKIWPVLKANAYGHGLKEMCQILNQSPAEMVVVDSFPEAQIAYRYFRKRILILSELPVAAYRYTKFSRTEFCVYNVDTFKYLARYHQQARVHLFLNTGMNREGIDDLNSFLAAVKTDLPKLKIVGLASHLASADEDKIENIKQQEKFWAAVELLKAQRIDNLVLHLGNSAAIFSTPDKRFSAFRAGLALYGYNPFVQSSQHYLVAQKLKPALRITSKITAVRKIAAGEHVSYNQSYEASQATNIGVIPFGYFEGLDRRFSNQAELRCLASHPFYAKIAGRVCMNITALELGANPVKLGDGVEVISPDNLAPNSINNLASLINTIPYEILVRIQSNIHREIV